MQYSYPTQGTCSLQITFEIDEGRVHNVNFLGGCSGNTQGVARLVEGMPVEGMPVEEVISRLRGIRCGGKPTSCPDQLARALEAARSE